MSNYRADAGTHIVMRHTNINLKGLSMPTTYESVNHPDHDPVHPETDEQRERRIEKADKERADKERAERTDLSSLRATDDASKAVQKTENRVTLDSILARIRREEYILPIYAQHMTICVLVLDNGFAVVGKSAPADPENYDEELGKRFAQEDAIRQLWPLEAYVLRERMTKQPSEED